MAAVASTWNEILLLNYMINEAKDRKGKFYLVNQLAERFRTTLFRQALFAEFEWETYKLSWNGTPLTKDLLCGLYHELNSEYYGKETVLCVPVRHRIFGGDGHRETDPGRRPGDEGRLFPLLKRLLFQDTGGITEACRS